MTSPTNVEPMKARIARSIERLKGSRWLAKQQALRIEILDLFDWYLHDLDQYARLQNLNDMWKQTCATMEKIIAIQDQKISERDANLNTAIAAARAANTSTAEVLDLAAKNGNAKNILIEARSAELANLRVQLASLRAARHAGRPKKLKVGDDEKLAEEYARLHPVWTKAKRIYERYHDDNWRAMIHDCNRFKELDTARAATFDALLEDLRNTPPSLLAARHAQFHIGRSDVDINDRQTWIGGDTLYRAVQDFKKLAASDNRQAHGPRRNRRI